MRVLTWNVLTSEKAHFAGASWKRRKEAFEEAFVQSPDFDLMGFQEVMPEQLEFFADLFPEHDFYAAGRDDGGSGGEHCPIFFRRERFEVRKKETFWLTPTPDKPSYGWGELFPRICSRVILFDRKTEKEFAFSNTHLPLHPFARAKAARLIASKLPNSPMPQVLSGDFNCLASSPALRIFREAGFQPTTEERAPTFHMCGLKIFRLDYILVSSGLQPGETRIISSKFREIFPSDHFGLWVEFD